MIGTEKPLWEVVNKRMYVCYVAFNSQQKNGIPSFPCDSERVQIACELLIESDYLIGS